MRTSEIVRRLHDEKGLGLVEIVVAMSVLALLAIAFLPMLVTGLKLSASGSTVTTATQLVSEQIALARSSAPTCAALTSFSTPTTSTTTVQDGNGRVLTTTRSVVCPSSYPGTARFSATVAAGGAAVASASTLIYVGS